MRPALYQLNGWIDAARAAGPDDPERGTCRYTNIRLALEVPARRRFRAIQEKLRSTSQRRARNDPKAVEEVTMGMPIAAERRLLSEDELGPVARSHYPELESLSRDQLIELARWLRSRRARARDLVRHRRRAGRSKADSRTPAPEFPGERGMTAKKQVFSHSLRRVNARLNHLLAEEKHAPGR